MYITLCLPTYNAQPFLPKWIESYQSQSLKADQVIVIDSSSTDKTVELALSVGFSVHQIPKLDFNHGGTRNLAVSLANPNSDIVIFLTQDAILSNPESLENILKPFENPKVVAVYGRQLPHINANPIAAHARLFNYPEISQIKDQQGIKTLGIKTVFISNSFAAYRKSVFEQLGGFPNDTILAEDMHLAAQMILSGYNIAYCADAQVYHSHNYNLFEEFKRYFDIGVFQQKEQWIQEKFGRVGGEGKKFVFSEFKFLLKNSPLWLPKAFFFTIAKYIGFKLGLNWHKLPKNWLLKLSMHKSYWINKK